MMRYMSIIDGEVEELTKERAKILLEKYYDNVDEIINEPFRLRTPTREIWTEEE